MKESGKSRADLWAFAALVAIQWSGNANNLGCQGKGKFCGAIRHDQDDCEMNLAALKSFKTGRQDCTPDSDLDRPFLTTKEEIHPTIHGNGPTTVNYFKDNFGMTAREAAALVEGAHSLGKINEEVSLSIYSWTRGQEQYLNNQLFRELRLENMFKSHQCGKKHNDFFLLGNASGQPAETSWQVVGRGLSVGGGPFQWFRKFNMCPKNTQELLAKNEGCGADLPAGHQCKPECQTWQQIMETSFHADAGFYYKFETDPVTGKPSGCKGFDNWGKAKGFNKGGIVAHPECELEDYAPEGEPLYSIIDDYALNQQKWFDDFVSAVDKMSANGYDALTTTDFDFSAMLAS